jgi:hypothetical protein
MEIVAYLAFGVVGTFALIGALGTPAVRAHFPLRLLLLILCAGCIISGIMGVLSIVAIAIERVSAEDAATFSQFLRRWGPVALQACGGIALIVFAWVPLALPRDFTSEDPRLELKLPGSRAGRVVASILTLLPAGMLLLYAFDGAFLTSYSDVLAPVERVFEAIGKVGEAVDTAGSIAGFFILVALTIFFLRDEESRGCGCLLTLLIGAYLYWMVSSGRISRLAEPFRSAVDAVF